MHQPVSSPPTAFHGRPALLAALAVLALGACSREPAAEAQEQGLASARLREPTQVLVTEVERREMVRRLETTTRVESVQRVELFPRTTGVLTELLVEEGDPVSVGQVLARIDDRAVRIAKQDAEAALAEARESLPQLALAVSEAEARERSAASARDQAQRDHDRNLAISQGIGGRPGLLSAKDLDASQLALNTAIGDHETASLATERARLERKSGEGAVARAQLALEKAEVDLSYTKMTSPLDGVVSERMVNVGDNLTNGAAAFVLTNPDELRAVFFRPQRELLLFRSSAAVKSDGPDGGGGLELVARADGLPGREFTGWIERVSPTVDPASGNFRVTARIDTGEPPHQLLPGMLVRLEIVTERHPDALVVPKKALIREGDQALLFAVDDERRARKLVVKEGFSEGDDVEIEVISGGALEAGDLVVVVGKELEPGDELTWPEAPAEPDPAEAGAAEPDGDEPGQTADTENAAPVH